MRLTDLNIESCQGCSTCIQSLFEGGEGNCVSEDDLPLLDEQIMECDGLILGSPVWLIPVWIAWAIFLVFPDVEW